MSSTQPAERDAPRPAKQPERFLRIDQVLNRVGESRTSWYEGMAAGLRPKSLHLPGTRTVVWREAELDAFMEAIIKAAA